ncbi:Type II/IV secretion system protein [uncultured archaeon]|nr:Type II/IV secretion system protein [uncultured archaeon]
MTLERQFVSRESRGFDSLDSIVDAIEESPVLVESQRPIDAKGFPPTRPDYFSHNAYTELAVKRGILPMIVSYTHKELIVGVHVNSSQISEAGDSIRLVDFDWPFEQLLPASYAAKKIGSHSVVPIQFDDSDYKFLFKMVGSPEAREKFLKDKAHVEDESRFEIGTDLAARNVLRQVYRRAFSLSASDIHFEWTERGPRVRYRVNDLLQDDPVVSPFSERKERPVGNDLFTRVIGAIKVDSADNGIIVHEHRKTQSGAFDFDKISWIGISEREDLPKGYTARVSVLPSIYGENVNIRLLKKGKLLTLGQLGYSPEVVRQFEDISTEPHGIVIATGPTGSGKTTTLNALISHSNTPDQKIITIENPVEYTIHGVHQCQVSRVNSFEEILREILRHDPDTTMLGEIRDKTTANVAINLALTGHLAYATLHTNDANGALLRLQKMGVEDYELQDTLKAVFAQRLVRDSCPHCKVIDSNANVNSLFKQPLFREDIVLYRPSREGCDQCNHSGIAGRSAITEVWQISDTTKDMIGQGVRSGTKYLEQAMSEGMRPLAMAALDKLLRGQISIDEVVRVVGKPEFKNKERLLKSLVSPELAR